MRLRRIALDLMQIRESNFTYTGYALSAHSTFVYCSVSVAQLLERRMQTHLFLDAFHVNIVDYVILILVCQLG